MRVLLVLVGVLVLGYWVADRVRQLPGGNAVALKSAVAAVPSRPVIPVAAVQTQPEPEKRPEPVRAAAPTPPAETHSHPVALVSLDPTTARFPAKPSDPIGEFALVLPASTEAGATELESHWWKQDGSKDLTGNVTQLRSAWPHAGSALAYAGSGDLPSSPSAVGSPATGAEHAAAPVARHSAAPAQPPASRVAAVETPADEPATRSIEETPADQAPAATAPAASPSAVRPMPVPRGAAAPKHPPRAANRQLLPPPPGRLASAAPAASSYAADGRPALACTTGACGPKLLLLGVGF
jgi:hypothetical protein